jgi:hypothetical protein
MPAARARSANRDRCLRRPSAPTAIVRASRGATQTPARNPPVQMTQLADSRRSAAAPFLVVAPLSGLAVYLLVLGFTQAFYTLGDWLLDVAAGGAAAAVAGTVAWWVGRSGDASHISRAGFALTVVGLLSLPVTYYLGVPEVFGATAIALAATARAASGRWSVSSAAATTVGLLAIIIGAAALAASW